MRSARRYHTDYCCLFATVFCPGLAASPGVASWRDLDSRQAHRQCGVAHTGFVPRLPLHQLSSGDDTIERRFSKKLKGIGCYRDPVRSGKKHVIHCFGLKWVPMSVLAPVPFSSHTWSLPFLNALCEPEEKDEKTNGKKANGKKAR